MARPQGPCYKCRQPITSGQWLGIAGMDYHATCFNCDKCTKNVYGKQFVPDGEPHTTDWKIFCERCSPFADVEINYNDVRPEEDKRSLPAQLPHGPRQTPVNSSPSHATVDAAPSGTVRAISAIAEAKREEKERQERLAFLEQERKNERVGNRQSEIDHARSVKSQRQQEELEAAKELASLRQSDLEFDAQRQEAVRKAERERQQRVAADNAGFGAQLREEEAPPPPPPKQLPGRLPQTATGVAKPASSPTKSPAPQGRGSLLDSIRSFDKEHLGAKPPGAAGSTVPHPAGAGGPPPPPPPVGGRQPRGAAPPPRGRGALLGAIEGFQAGALRPTATNDRSGVFIEPRSTGSSESGTSPRGAGRGGANPLAAALNAHFGGKR